MRNIGRRAPIALAVALGAALGLTVGDVAAQEEEQQQEQEEIECTATLSPVTIATTTEPVVLGVNFSEEIGTAKEVRPQEGSGLEVLRVEKPERTAKAEIETEEEEFEEAADQPQYDLQLRLNAANAQEGDWELRFEGTEGACKGRVHVEPVAEGEMPPAEAEEEAEPPLR